MLTVTLLHATKRHKNIRKHIFWKHPIFKKRKQFGSYYHLIKELNLDDAQFHNYLRINKAQFDTKQGRANIQETPFYVIIWNFLSGSQEFLVRFGLRLRLRFG